MKEWQPITEFETSWERELALAYRTATDLVNAGLITADAAPRLAPVLSRYKFLLPRYYASLIDRDDPNCPIRRQAVPRVDELGPDTDLNPDPLADLRHQPVPRITHRYQGRVLLHLTPNCSMYCRYCFRKTLLNELKEDLFHGPVAEALRYVREDESVAEVIFSGGDPFMVRDETLAATLSALADIPHVQRVRFHSRVPVTFPMRVTPSLAAVLTGTRLPSIVVTHFNVARELTPSSQAAIGRLKAAGSVLLNQSVLLRGVNDSVPALAALSEKLFASGILPYYLHHPDRAAGTGHFDIPVSEGVALHETLKARLSGYLVPRYVVDEPTSAFKRELSASFD